MDTLHERCAGIDVHKNLIVACRWVVTGGTVDKEIKSFGATTRELQERIWAGGGHDTARS